VPGNQGWEFHRRPFSSPSREVSLDRNRGRTLADLPHLVVFKSEQNCGTIILPLGHGGRTSFPLIFCSGVLTTLLFSRKISPKGIDKSYINVLVLRYCYGNVMDKKIVRRPYSVYVNKILSGKLMW